MASTEPISRRDTPAARWVQWLVGLAFAVGLVWAWSTGQLAWLDLAGVRAMVESAGSSGRAVYVIAFGFLQPFGVSAHLFIVAAGLIWPVPEALLWTQLGLNLSSGVSYGIGRALAPDTLRARIPPRVLAWEERLRSGGLPSVIAVRVVFFSFFPLSALMGAMRIPFRNYALGSFIGYLPVAIAEVLLAHELAGWLER